MNVNLYLPDHLGTRAKEAELPLSRLLRDAVTDELERRAMTSKTLTEPQTFELQLEDEEGRSYTGRITGALIATGHRDVELYLLDDERLIGYDPNRPEHWEFGNEATMSLEDEVRGFLNDDGAYIEAMHAIGEKPVIDL